MLREIAALRTLAGTPVPHPGFIAGCDDLDVLGVVFYLMEVVDGFNPGDDMDEAYVRDPSMRHRGRAVLCGQPGAARQRRLGGQPAGGAQAAGFLSGAPGSAVPAAARKLSARQLRARIAGGDGSGGVAAVQPPARRRARNHARRPASEQCSAAPRQAGVGGVRRLGDVHHRRPTAGSGVDVDLLAPGHVHHHRGGPNSPHWADWPVAANSSTRTSLRAAAKRQC